MENNIHQCILPPELPMALSLYHDYEMPSHCHINLELLIVLEGSVRLEMGGAVCELHKDDCVCINPMELHSFRASGSVMASIQMNIYGIYDMKSRPMPDKFQCNSAMSNVGDFDNLRSIAGQILRTANHPDGYYAVHLKSLMYQLLYSLMSDFGIYRNEKDRQNPGAFFKPALHLEKAMDYMLLHFTEKLTLDRVAGQLNLTPQYLTRLFRQYLNMSFFELLSKLRLEHAKILMDTTDGTVEQIADMSGFPNTRALIDKFKECFGLTPGRYMKEKGEQKPSGQAAAETSEIFLHAFEVLYGYIREPWQILPNMRKPLIAREGIAADVSRITDRFRHKPLSIISFDKGQELLYGESQTMLRQIQEDLHFEFVRFHGLFNDAIGIYSEDFSGKIRLSFNVMDQIFDFILSVGLKPMVELSFMPRQLSRHIENSWVDGNHFSYPKSMEKWNYLVTSLVTHLESRYGRGQVSGWPFWVWNQPDNPHSPFYLDAEHFLELYNNTYRAIKKINPDIAVGTPSFMTETLLSPEKYNIYEHYWQTHDCLPDFININFYSVQLDSRKVPGTNQNIPILSMDDSQLRHKLEEIHRNRKKYHWHMDRLYLQEWNYHLGTDLLSDTLFKGVYILKNILENHNQIQQMGFWTLVDFAEKYSEEDCPFRGDFGVYTYNGIKKCAYYALSFINRLGPEIIHQSDYVIITRNGSSYQLLLYNYVHYKEAYARREYHDITVTQRYHQFDSELSITYNITLKNLPGTRYLATESTINHRHGSAYEQWAETGGMAALSKEDATYINQISLPLMRRTHLTPEAATLNFPGELAPLEIKLIELTPL